RDFFGSLVLGLYQGGELIYTGNVGTGFNQKTLKQLFDLMQPLIVKSSPFKSAPKLPKGSVFLQPKLVCEIKFAQFTKDNILRAPVYMGLRTDVPPEKCVREIPREPKAVTAKAKPKKPSKPAKSALLDTSQKEA